MYRTTHLQSLEAEAIHVIREVAACFDNPCIFYSIGKDSSVLLHLARKAFYPASVPIRLLHIDTTWEFHEMAQFRDRLVEQLDLKLVVHINNDALAQGIHPILSGSVKYNDHLKTMALKQAIDQHRFDAGIDLAPLYFARPRMSWIDDDNGQVFALDDDRMLPFLSEQERASLQTRVIRFRTLGCYPQSGAVVSEARILPEIIQELLLSKSSERQGRTIDTDQPGSMEKKKLEGYF